MTSGHEMTEVEAYRRTHEGAIEWSAAELTGEVQSLLGRARRASGIKQTDLARNLGVSEGRVSQVLNGDGNLTIAALAKYMHAFGYKVRISVEPLTSATPPLPKFAKKRRRVTQLPVKTRGVSDAGQATVQIAQMSLDSYGWVDLIASMSDIITRSPGVMDAVVAAAMDIDEHDRAVWKFDVQLGENERTGV